MSSLTKLENRAIIGLASIFSLRMLGLFMILPVFSLHAKQLQGVTPFSLGMALGIYGLTQACLQIPFGRLSDKLGRKPVIIAGLLIFSIGSGLAAISDSIVGVVIGRALQGAGAIGCVLMALVADITRETIRTRAMAGIGMTIGLSFALAMVLGPFCAEWVGVRGIFWLSALLGLMGIGILKNFVPTPEITVSILPAFFQTLHMLLNNTAFVRATMGILILHCSLTAVFLKMPIQSGFFYGCILLASLFSTVLMIFYAEKYKKNLLVNSISILLFAECMIFYVMNVEGATLGLAIGLWLFFTAFNFLEARLPALVSSCIPQEIKGTALGVFSSAQFLGLFLGGALGGWLDALYGTIAIAGFCVILAITWLKLILVRGQKWQHAVSIK